MTLQEIAKLVGGTLEGDGGTRIQGVASLLEAQPGDLSFLSNPRYAPQVAETQASAIIVSADWHGVSKAALVRVASPDRAFMQAAIALSPKPPVPEPGVHASAVVSPLAVLGVGVSVGPHAVIEAGAHVGARCIIGANCYVGHDTILGEDCRLYPLVSIRERTRIGNRFIAHNGAVIGSDGFGYVPEGGRWTKIPQLGIVEIGDDVEIGANTTIDRARFGRTVIGRGVKLDNLVQIAHNCQIGEDTAMAAQVGVSGSSIIGKGVQIGGQAGIAGHFKIGDGSVIGAQSGISKAVAPGTFMFGSPAIPLDKFKRIRAYEMGLPNLKKRVDELEARLERLEPNVDSAPAQSP